MTAKALVRLVLLASITLLVALHAAIALNNPGHDSLYVLKLGDSNVTGSINITNNLTASLVRFNSKTWGDYLDIIGDGTIPASPSVSTMSAAPNALYLDATGTLYLNTKAGTLVQVGPPVTNGVTLNVSGTIQEQGVPVCLANGTNCLTGTNTGNITMINPGSGINVTSPSGPLVTIGLDATVCRSDGTNCPLLTGASDAGGWANTSTTTSTALSVNLTSGNLTIPNGYLGIGTNSPQQALDVNGNGNIADNLWVNGSAVCTLGNGLCATFAVANATAEGMANYLARWTNVTNLVRGSVYDNGTSVGIGTANLTATLTVNGTETVNGTLAAASITAGNVTVGTTPVALAAACPAGQAVQNTTSSGVQCVSVGTGSGSVTQVNTGSFTTGGPITTAGTIDVNMTSVVVNIGNWSADKTNYATTASVNAKASPGTCPAGQVVMNSTSTGVQCVPASTGSVTSITRGIGFQNNGTSITSTGQLDINTSAIQNRVTGTCTYGINGVNSDGTVSCAGQQGTGTVNSGTVNQLAYYAGTGTAVSTLNIASGAVYYTGSAVTAGTLPVNLGGTGTTTSTGTGSIALNNSPTISSPTFAGTVTGGTFSGGTWQGNAIADAYIASSTSWNNKAGSANCPAGQLVQNTTSTGVQCIVASTGSVTQVNTGSFTTGGPITTTGTIDVNITAIANNIGNWSADKTNYATTPSVNTKASPGSCPVGQVAQNTTASGVQCVATSTGSVTSITRGVGLTNNGTSISTTGELDINTSAIQNRVTGSCTYGINGVNSDGTVSCAGQQGTGTGTVNSGSANKIAYYPGAGTTLGNLTGNNNGAIYYDGSGNVQSGTLPVASGGTGTTTSTGSGSVALNNSPVITSPTIVGTGSITASTGAFTTLTRGGVNVCTSDGTNCPSISGSSSAGGWSNTSTQTTTLLNVGIGTTSPLAKLHVVTSDDSLGGFSSWDARHFVVGASGNTGGVALSYSQTNNAGVIEAVSPGAAVRPLLINPQGGNVGIGTTSPGAPLTIGTNTGTVPAATNVMLNAGGIVSSSVFAGRISMAVNSNADYGPYIGSLWLSSGGQTALVLGTRQGAVDTNALYVTSGNVGIGTTSPGYRLDVQGGTIRTSGDLQLEDTGLPGSIAKITRVQGGATDAGMSFSTTWGTTQERMRITNVGNVGIGTTSPGYLLDVNGGGHYAGTLTVPTVQGPGTATYVDLTLQNNAATAGIQVGENGGAYGWDRLTRLFAGGVTFDVNPSYISTNGNTFYAGTLYATSSNVGIGTTSPGAMLDVNSGGGASNTNGLNVYDSSNGGYTVLKAYTNWGDGNGGTILNVGDASGAALFINNNRNVGIGTTNPWTQLVTVGKANFGNTGQTAFVAGSPTLQIQQPAGTEASMAFWRVGQAGAILGNAASASDYNFYITNLRSASSLGQAAYSLTLDPNGNVGIGTTGPSTKLEVDSNNAPENSNPTPLGGLAVKSTASTALVMGVDPSSPYEGWLQVRHGTVAGYTYPLSLQPLGGNVGIGNTGPRGTLDVTGIGDGGQVFFESSGRPFLNIKGAANSYKTLRFSNSGNNNDYRWDMNIIPGNDGTNPDGIGFWSQSGGEVLAIKPNGNLGIGTTSPGQRLDVSGNVAVSGSVMPYARYTDSGGPSGDFLQMNTLGSRMVSLGGGSDGGLEIGSNMYRDGSNNALRGAGDISTAKTYFAYDGSIWHSTAGSGSGPITWVNNYALIDSSQNLNVIGQARIAGNVGIGTTSPGDKLQVSGGGIELDQGYYVWSPTTGNLIGFSAGGTVEIASGNYPWSIGASSDTNQNGRVYTTGGYGSISLRVALNGADRFTIAGPNVGIGTTSPGMKLDIMGNSGSKTSMQLYNSDYVTSLTGSGFFAGTGASSGNTYSQLQAFTTGDTVGGVLSLNPYGGNVGIGTTDPGTKLYVNGDISIPQYSSLYVTGTNQNYYIQYGSTGLRFYMGGDDLYLSNGGTVGVATTSPGNTLDVNGNIRDRGVTSCSYVGTNGNGDFVCTASDRRVKTNITALPDDLALIEQLRPVSFRFINESMPQAVQYGFVAQDLQPVFPSLVSTTNPTPLTPNGTLTINYVGLIAPLTKAVQEEQDELQTINATAHRVAQDQEAQMIAQNATDTALADRLASVEADNAALRSEVAELRAAVQELQNKTSS